MESNQLNDFPWSSPEPSHNSNPRKKEGKRFSLGALFSAICITLAVTLLFTYTLTSALDRAMYTAVISEQDEKIRELEELLDAGEEGEFDKLTLLSKIFEIYSYYDGTVSEEEILDQVLKTYARATGDDYAEYYTEEEYQELASENSGNQVGIGISVVQDTVEYEGGVYSVFQIVAIFQNSPAASSELRVGDYIAGLKSEGSETYLTVDGLGGYTKALSAMRGEAGSYADLMVFRRSGSALVTKTVSICRGSYVSESVSHAMAESDPTVGIVKIMQFDLTTPSQLKAAIESLRASGAEKFVFDVRNNPGGDLRSIKAVMSYFLEKNSLILSVVDRDNRVVESHVSGSMLFTGDYAGCSVKTSEVGMYADLDMVVLCNGNTASAAEVFTAGLQDHGKAVVVGETTFGKGIMQSYIPLSYYSNGRYDGYAKMTTSAYMTERGVTYHDIGIEPDEAVSLSEEAMAYSVYTLPQSLDAQLQRALEILR